MRVQRNEQGIAMVTSILTSVIVVLLGVVATSLAVHNTTVSGIDRSRTQSVHVAEAGINRVVNIIQKNPPQELAKHCTITGQVAGSLPGTYQTSVEYYRFYPFDRSNPGHRFDCASMTSGTVPRGAFINSVGSVTGAATQRRTMQAQFRLTPILGGFNSAVFSDSGSGWNNQFTLRGNQTFDGDVYTNGNWSCKGNVKIEGSVYAQGTAQSDGCVINVDLWANGKVTIAGNALVREDAVSSTDDVDVTGANNRCKPDSTGCTVERNASAGKSCIDCKTVTNQGTKVKGEVLQNNVIGAPPKKAFPQLRFIRSAWEDNGYVVEFATSPRPLIYTFDAGTAAATPCTAAQQWIENQFPSWSAPRHVVVRISGGCDLSFTNNAVITMPKHLAIVTDGSITLEQQTTFKSSDSSPRNIYLIVPYFMHPDDDGEGGATSSQQSCSPAPRGQISMGNNTNFQNVRFSVYSPCKVTFANNNAGNEGQIYGGTVDISNQAQLKYNPLLIPGAGEVSGFNVDPAFLREVVNT